MTQHYDETQSRDRLQHERERVEGLITGLRSEGLDQTEADQAGELSHYDQHPADTASDTFEREKDLAILEQLEGELAEIEAALQRLDEGTYGVDEVTGEPIDPERLDAFPTARTNIERDRS
jgi:RNA polymerase-binding transcription factor DksA